jgi:hypothetical protein
MWNCHYDPKLSFKYVSLMFSCFTREEIKAWRDEVTESKSHNGEVEVWIQILYSSNYNTQNYYKSLWLLNVWQTLYLLPLKINITQMSQIVCMCIHLCITHTHILLVVLGLELKALYFWVTTPVLLLLVFFQIVPNFFALAGLELLSTIFAFFEAGLQACTTMPFVLVIVSMILLRLASKCYFPA